MKRKLAIILSAFILILSGCGGNATSEQYQELKKDSEKMGNVKYGYYNMPGGLEQRKIETIRPWVVRADHDMKIDAMGKEDEAEIIKKIDALEEKTENLLYNAEKQGRDELNDEEYEKWMEIADEFDDLFDHVLGIDELLEKSGESSGK